jgi:hypothetical protein
MVQGDHGRIAQAPLEIADILLGHAGNFGERLLGKALRQPQSRKVSADQPAHVHACRLDGYTLSGLSLIMCTHGRWITSSEMVPDGGLRA